MNTWTSLSNEIEAAVEKAAPSIVQVHGHRRVTAGLVIADNLIATPAATEDEKVAVLTGDPSTSLGAGNQTMEGVVLGRDRQHGAHRRARGRPRPPRPVGRQRNRNRDSWLLRSAGPGAARVMATLAPVAVVGGPLRTGRASAIDRVIRIQQSPHGALNGGALINSEGQALGIITSLAIRGTTVVIPASLAWAAATKVASEGGVKQGFLGVSSMPVPSAGSAARWSIAGVGPADQPRGDEQSC